MAKIVETDNFGGDYPNEKFVQPLPALMRAHAQRIADAINSELPGRYPRYWKVVDDDYQLQSGFEP